MTAGTARVPAAEPADQVLVITRMFDAPRSLVFKAWTEREHLIHWSAPRGFTMPHCEGDPRPGGAWRCCMRSPEGKDYWLRGVYRELVAPERLVFTHVWEDDEGRPGQQTLVTVTFAEQGGKTRLTLHQADFESVEQRDSHGEGWAECLDKLEGYVATM